MDSTAAEDIAYLRKIAELGKKLPIQGGEFGILWGGMYAFAAVYAYLVLTGIIVISTTSVAMAFLLPIPVGVVLGHVLSKKRTRASGVASFGNRTSAAAWSAVGISTGVLYFTVLSFKWWGFLKLPEGYIFGALQAVLFGMYAVAYATTAQSSGDNRQFVFSGFALLAAVASILTMNSYQMFLVMAAGLLLSAVLPGFLTRTHSELD